MALSYYGTGYFKANFYGSNYYGPQGVAPVEPDYQLGLGPDTYELQVYKREANARELFDIISLVVLSGVLDE